MAIDFRNIRRQLIVLSVLWFSVLPAMAQMDTGLFLKYLNEANAMNQDDPGANLFRAGLYKGYMLGVQDALRTHKTCSRGCTCELDKVITQYLADNPALVNLPVIDWLPSWLEERFPCQ